MDLLTRPQDRIQFAGTILPWGEARVRECIQAILDRASNEAPGQNGPGPEGYGAFGLWLRCASGRRALAMLPSLRLATSQNRRNKLYSILGSGQYVLLRWPPAIDDWTS